MDPNILYSAIPADIHADTLPPDEPSLEQARNALAIVYATTGEIEKAERQMGPNGDKHTLWELAAPLLRQGVKATGAALDHQESQVRLHEAQLASALAVPAAHAAHAAEIRAHYKAAKSPFTLLVQAANEGDILSSAAVLAAPAYLSGLTATQARELREIVSLQAAPDIVARRDLARKAVAKLQRALEFVGDFGAEKSKRYQVGGVALDNLKNFNPAQKDA